MVFEKDKTIHLYKKIDPSAEHPQKEYKSTLRQSKSNISLAQKPKQEPEDESYSCYHSYGSNDEPEPIIAYYRVRALPAINGFIVITIPIN